MTLPASLAGELTPAESNRVSLGQHCASTLCIVTAQDYQCLPFILRVLREWGQAGDGGGGSSAWPYCDFSLIVHYSPTLGMLSSSLESVFESFVECVFCH